jgi:hypothetical protein
VIYRNRSSGTCGTLPLINGSSGIRAREVVTRGGMTSRFKVPSVLLGRVVHVESVLERDFVFRLDQDLDVLDFGEQPFRLDYLLDGRRHHHFPDFIVRRRSVVQIAEIKYESRLTEDVRRRTVILAGLFAPIGIEYVIITNKDIYQQPSFENITLLRRYRRHPLSESTVVEIAARIGPAGCLLGELGAENWLNAIAMVGRRMLRVDLSAPLGPETHATLVEEVP